jgi:hypothetical protein
MRRRPFNEDDYYKNESPVKGLLITAVLIALLSGAIFGLIKFFQWLANL